MTKKCLKIPKGLSESVYRRTDNTTAKCCQVYCFLRVHSDCHLLSKRPPRSILNIVEIGVTHQQLTTIVADLVTFSKK